MGCDEFKWWWIFLSLFLLLLQDESLLSMVWYGIIYIFISSEFQFPVQHHQNIDFMFSSILIYSHQFVVFCDLMFDVHVVLTSNHSWFENGRRRSYHGRNIAGTYVHERNGIERAFIEIRSVNVHKWWSSLDQLELNALSHSQPSY